MCGIIGHISIAKPIDADLFSKATDLLAHRGPDDRGIYKSEDGNISLGHRRLSFLDLSEHGRQPMVSSDRAVVVTFNGEIYNYRELKNQLSDGFEFKTNTDTEVIIAAYLKWGTTFVDRLKGMFAIALLDQTEQRLLLIRDRFGIKPLYYSSEADSFSFGSELKAIHCMKEGRLQVDFSSMADLLVYRYVPSPKTIWKEVNKLPPAHMLNLSLKDLSYSISEYWKLEPSDIKVNERELVDQVRHALVKSTQEHLRSDVPVGAFLSGGYDSSALAYFMKQEGHQPETFSVGFANWQGSEDQFATAVSNHLSLPNTSITLDESSLELVDLMSRVYDEPIADISIVPTYSVSKLARQKVKAVFSGEGADELFGGYTWQHQYYQEAHPRSFKKKLNQFLNPMNPIEFYAEAMSMGMFDAAELRSVFSPDVYSQAKNQDVHWFYKEHLRPEFGGVKAIQYLDIKTFMGELVLTKVDRASMANSLEVRVPFLDHELFEYVFAVQEKLYLRPEQTKFLLFENIKNALPSSILNRKKQGFVGPDSYYMNTAWYKGQLRTSNLVKDGIVRQGYIDQLLTKSYDWKLWKILILEKWYSAWCI